MKKTAKILCLLLAVLMLATLAAACDTETGETSSAAASGTTSTETEGFRLEKQDWGGVTINILTHNARDYALYEFGTPAQETEIESDNVSTAFQERTNLLEEEYGLTTQVHFTEGGIGAPTNEIEQQIIAGLSEYDLVADGITYLTKLGTQEYFWNYYELDNGYIDLNADYWDQSAIEDLAIANKLYYITGEAVVSDNAATWALYYNKDLLEDYGLTSPVELVDAGTWTVDALYEMCKSVATKVSSGDTMSYEPGDGDIWGMVAQAYDGLAFMWGAEQAMITKDEDDLPIMRILDERNVSAWQTISEMLYDKSCVGVADLFGNWADMYENESQIFTNGNAAFMPGAITVLDGEAMNNSDVRFGILPMPKLDENQEEYATSCTVYWATFFSIPTSNVEKLDATCYLLEAMAYYGQEMCTYEYYDKTLKLKRMEDPEDERMLDLLFQNRTFDLGAVYDWAGPKAGMLQFYTGMIGQTSSDIISSYESKRDSFQAAINATIDTFTK